MRLVRGAEQRLHTGRDRLGAPASTAEAQAPARHLPVAARSVSSVSVRRACPSASAGHQHIQSGARLSALWRFLLPALLLFLLGSAFALGVLVVLPELLSGLPLFISRAAGAGFYVYILFNFAAAVLHSPGALPACLVSHTELHARWEASASRLRLSLSAGTPQSFITGLPGDAPHGAFDGATFCQRCRCAPGILPFMPLLPPQRWACVAAPSLRLLPHPVPCCPGPRYMKPLEAHHCRRGAHPSLLKA